MASLIFYFEEDSFVFDYVLMFEFFYIYEIFLQVEEMFLIELHSFNSQQFIIYFSVAFSDNSMSAFTQFGTHYEALVEIGGYRFLLEFGIGVAELSLQEGGVETCTFLAEFTFLYFGLEG